MPRTKKTVRSVKESKYHDAEERDEELDGTIEAAAVKKKSKGKKGKEPTTVDIDSIPDHSRLSSLLYVTPVIKKASFWVVGDTPLIVHAWSEKAKREMLAKQRKDVRAAREARDPEEDFLNSLYDMGDGRYGFPVTGVKNAILSCAHKDKGVAKSAVQSALFMRSTMTRLRPALAGAICDMPLIEVYGAKPEMREDMVKIGSGLQKVASLAYRAQFFPWAFKLQAELNPMILTPAALAFLVQTSGKACGVGEWRNEKRGVFGAYHLASVEEEIEWEAYRLKKGPLPVPADNDDGWGDEPVPMAAE